jgi:hypothetical protein
MKLYINQLFRYGDTKAHSYCSPIFSCPYLAEITKELMVGYRGGKYEAETFEFDLLEKDQYYLAEIFTENEENKQIQLFDNIEKADEWLASFSFHQKKLSVVTIKNDLININILEAHEYLDRISLNAQSKLRDLYEKYLRAYYYY